MSLMTRRAASHFATHAGTITLIAAALLLSASGALAQQRVALPANDRALQPQLENVLRIGAIDGADWEVFGENLEVAFDGAGNLYVLDPTSHRVVVINPAGRFLRQVGRRGDGPGELRNPMGFAVERDGTVIVADMGHGAYLVFAPDGTFRRSVSFRGTAGFTALGHISIDPRGGSLLTAGQRAAMMQAGGGMRLGSAPPPNRSIARVDLRGNTGATPLFTGWSPPPAPTAQQVGGAMVRRPPRAFEPGFFAAALPNGGIVVSDSTAYNLKVLSPQGELERLLQRPLRPAALTPQIERAERERRLAELGSGGGGGQQVSVATQGGGGGGAPSPSQVQAIQRQMIEQLEFYPEISVVTGLAAGWTGRIWVSRAAPPSTPSAPGPIDVITPAGEYQGTVPAGRMTLPAAFGPNGLAAWIERDRFDTPIVVVRRLPQELR